MSHIQATPGFAGTGWPHEMTPAENLRDLERHAQDYADRRGFTYTVLGTGSGDVIGCVYIYPPRPPRDQTQDDVAVSSWVRADHAELDPVLYRTVSAWLEQAWPFRSVKYAPRA
jgi:hypothetical protein